MRWLWKGLVFIAVLGVAVLGYTKIMARIGSGPVPVVHSAERQADLITVEKRERRMVLWRGGRALASYDISLGAASDAGHKQREGDERTPEGRYVIDWRNPRSVMHLSLHISYPNAEDKAAAQAGGFPPGGNIMIHGLPNGWGWLGSLHRFVDWTDGCIAVTNREMREIWSLVPNSTPIEIRA